MDAKTAARIAAFLAAVGGGYYLGYEPNDPTPTWDVSPTPMISVEEKWVTNPDTGERMLHTYYWVPGDVIRREQLPEETFEEAKQRILQRAKEEHEARRSGSDRAH